MDMYSRMAAGKGGEKKVSNKPNDTSVPKVVSVPKKETTISRYHDINGDIVLGKPTELIRRAVKQVGKETTNYRLTAEEKSMIEDLVYSFKRRGIRTSENEIMRIALNNLFNDYQEHGDNSILSTVLESLNA